MVGEWKKFTCWFHVNIMYYLFHICWRFDAFLFYQKQSHKAYSITLIKSNFFPSPDWNRSLYSINVGGEKCIWYITSSSMRTENIQDTDQQFLESLHCGKKMRGNRVHRASHSWASVNNPPKNRLKKSLNWRIILVPATIWQILNDRKRKLFELLETCMEKLISRAFIFGWF